MAFFDGAQRRSKRRESHKLKSNESSDLEDITPPPKDDEKQPIQIQNDGTQVAAQSLYKKVSQRKQIIQKSLAQNYNRGSTGGQDQ